ncbi:Sugar phosphatase YfbT [Mycena sanguinolenta]|uniref:Sugar phosphatase YfbT n=1 Tax=Mycena sanguinolenta TaxID=230812 RepID=A0A8H7DCS1_9AGAR|nr:Sugar phosphatase YfbT [Mycena sanguinolenta]
MRGGQDKATTPEEPAKTGPLLSEIKSIRLLLRLVSLLRLLASMAPTTIVVDAILFDMDGTLIDSTPGLVKAWTTFCNDYQLGDPATVVHETHGRRLYDTLKEYCHINDESKLQAEIDRFEEEVINGGPIVLPGVSALVSALLSQAGMRFSPWNSIDSSSHHTQLSSETAFGWTIVTSATRNYAPRALERCSIPLPRAGIVCSDDVSQGKPHPAPYLAGASKCGVDPSKCLVVEDAISGMQAGAAAGALVLAVCTSTPRNTIITSGAKPSYVVTDLSKSVAVVRFYRSFGVEFFSRVSARWINDKIEVTIDEQ